MFYLDNHVSKIKHREGNFLWRRTSKDTASDDIWNSANHYGKELEITEEDVWYKAVFDCEVEISTTLE